jgi:hypothetical protein
MEDGKTIYLSLYPKNFGYSLGGYSPSGALVMHPMIMGNVE